MKSPTGRLTNLEPEIQYLKPPGQFGKSLTVAEHTMQALSMDFSELELRVLAQHDHDEYRSWFEKPETKPR